MSHHRHHHPNIWRAVQRQRREEMRRRASSPPGSPTPGSPLPFDEAIHEVIRETFDGFFVSSVVIIAGVSVFLGICYGIAVAIGG